MPLLYRYLRSGFLETIESGEMKVARVAELNDPFECCFAMEAKVPLEDARQFLLARTKSGSILQRIWSRYPNLRTRSAQERHLVKHTDEYVEQFLASGPAIREELQNTCARVMEQNFRIVCFSAADGCDRDGVLMWSHYADDHRGTRLGFEVPQDFFLKQFRDVDYQNDRVPFRLTLDPDSEEAKTLYMRLLKTKSESWRYEDEKRFLVLAPLCRKAVVKGKTMEFVPYDRSWLRSLDFGANALQADLDRGVDLIKRLALPISVRKARIDHVEFKLVLENVWPDSQ